MNRAVMKMTSTVCLNAHLAACTVALLAVALNVSPAHAQVGELTQMVGAVNLPCA